MYSNELKTDIKEFDISLLFLNSLIEKEFENNPVLEENLLYEDIFDTIKRTIITANNYNIPIENYIKLVVEANVAVYDYLYKTDGDMAGNFLRTLIVRICSKLENGNVVDISSNFIPQFNNIINKCNTIKDKDELCDFCEDIIGKRYAKILAIMIIKPWE